MDCNCQNKITLQLFLNVTDITGKYQNLNR